MAREKREFQIGLRNFAVFSGGGRLRRNFCYRAGAGTSARFFSDGRVCCSISRAENMGYVCIRGGLYVLPFEALYL